MVASSFRMRIGLSFSAKSWHRLLVVPSALSVFTLQIAAQETNDTDPDFTVTTFELRQVVLLMAMGRHGSSERALLPRHRNEQLTQRTDHVMVSP